MSSQGWFHEPKRHALSARGIKSGRKYKKVQYNYVFYKNLNYPQAKAFYKKLPPRGDFDKDGVPNFKDCRPFDSTKQDEERIRKAKEYFGITDDPHKAGWILPNGEMLDFSHENLEKLYKDPARSEMTGKGDIAHWEVGRSFGITGKPSIHYFQKEGAIRFRKTPNAGVYAQMIEKPTQEQAKTLARAIKVEPQPTFMVLEKVPSDIKVKLKQGEYATDTLDVDKPHPILIQKFISQAFD